MWIEFFFIVTIISDHVIEQNMILNVKVPQNIMGVACGMVVVIFLVRIFENFLWNSKELDV